jgi:uncharacterized protein YdaU (DUF1376 family)
MGAPAWMPLWIGDFLTDTQHLTVAETGAYMLLLMGMWNANGKLPRDEVKLARVARCTPAEWMSVREPVLAFFTMVGGVLRHKRVTAELDKAESFRRRASKAGKASAAKRASQINGRAVFQDAPELTPESKTSPSPSPSESKKENPPHAVANAPAPPLQGGASGLLPDVAADAPDVPKKTPPTPAIFLPDEWAPDDALVAFGVAMGLTPKEIFDEADEFRDHWRARRDSRARKADWPATFRNRLRKVVGDRLARPIAAPAAPNARRSNTSNFRNAWARRLDAPDDAEATPDGPRADRRDDAGRQGVLRLPGPGEP